MTELTDEKLAYLRVTQLAADWHEQVAAQTLQLADEFNQLLLTYSANPWERMDIPTLEVFNSFKIEVMAVLAVLAVPPLAAFVAHFSSDGAPLTKEDK